MHGLVPQLPGVRGFEGSSHRRAVMSTPARPDPALLYPLYSEREKKLMRRVL